MSGDQFVYDVLVFPVSGVVLELCGFYGGVRGLVAYFDESRGGRDLARSCGGRDYLVQRPVLDVKLRGGVFEVLLLKGYIM